MSTTFFTKNEQQEKSPARKAQARRVVGEDDNNGVKITARVATSEPDVPLRWRLRSDNTYCLEFRVDGEWIEVPILE